MTGRRRLAAGAAAFAGGAAALAGGLALAGTAGPSADAAAQRPAAAPGAVAGRSSPATVDRARDARVVRVRLAEWTVSPDVATVRAGRVTFATTNAGRVEHELLVLKTNRRAGDLALGLEGPALSLPGQRLVLGEAHGHGGHGAGGESHIPPGGRRRESVVLAPGRYVLLCSLPGHYEAGQRAELRVER